MYENTKAFKLKLWMWENKLNNLSHFLHLTSLDPVYLEHIQQYFPAHSFASSRVWWKITRTLKLWNQNFCCFALLLKGYIEKTAENLQMELINLKCDTNLKQKFSETELVKRKLSCVQILLDQNACDVW